MKRILSVLLIAAGFSLSALETLHRHSADTPARSCAACFVVDAAVVASASSAPSLSRIDAWTACVPTTSALVPADVSPLPSARGPPSV